eukprot:254458-Chlamydomonas_euryale.AAC.1
MAPACSSSPHKRAVAAHEVAALGGRAVAPLVVPVCRQHHGCADQPDRRHAHHAVPVGLDHEVVDGSKRNVP